MRIIFLCVVTLSFLLGSEKRDFIIGVQDFPEYMPYSQFQNEEYFGFNRELLDAFANDAGFSFQYEAVPVKRLYKMFLLKKVDLKYPDNAYWSIKQKRGVNIHYSDPVVRYVDGVIVLNKNRGKGLKNLKVLGIISGFTPYSYMDQIKKGTVQVHENNSYLGLLRMMFKNRVDGAYTNIAVSKYYFEHDLVTQDDQSALVFDPDLPHTESTRHLSTVDYPEVIEKFNQWMVDKKPFIDELKQKYRVEEGID